MLSNNAFIAFFIIGKSLSPILGESLRQRKLYFPPFISEAIVSKSSRDEMFLIKPSLCLQGKNSFFNKCV